MMAGPLPTFYLKRKHWHKGKVLWFDDLSGDGVALIHGQSVYFHWSCLFSKKERSKKGFCDRKNRKELKILSDMPILCIVFNNGYTWQIDEMRVDKRALKEMNEISETLLQLECPKYRN